MEEIYIDRVDRFKNTSGNFGQSSDKLFVSRDIRDEFHAVVAYFHENTRDKIRTAKTVDPAGIRPRKHGFASCSRLRWMQGSGVSRQLLISFMQLRCAIGARRIGYLSFIWQLICRHGGTLLRKYAFVPPAFSPVILIIAYVRGNMKTDGADGLIILIQQAM